MVWENTGNSEGTEKNSNPSIANLQPFKPGESGNPDGRPKGAKDSLKVQCLRIGRNRTYKEVYSQMIEKGINIEDGTNNEALAHVLWHQSLKGDMEAIRILSKIEDEAPVIPPNQKTIINIHGVQSKTEESKEPEFIINGVPLKKGKNGNGNY